MFQEFAFISIFLLNIAEISYGDGVVGCGGFVKSDVDINFSLVEVTLYTSHGSIKYQTDCAPNTGYYLIPLYDKGDFILKVEPPKGWTFEPASVELRVDGEKDACSIGEDINFLFTGFSLDGKVVSKGQEVGPASIPVTLSKAGSSDVLQTVQTDNDGSYGFTKVQPGDYDVHAIQEHLRFEQATTRVSVMGDNGNAGNQLVIAGYSVSGQVFSEGEPIKGVNFLLYSATVKQEHVYDCDKSSLPEVGKTKNYDPLCHVTSDATGKFIFPCLATGDYHIMPFYKGEHITFDVVPETMPFQVAHGSLTLPISFQVAGFSVSGLVLDSDKGSGIARAEVFVNGKSTSTTGVDGSYHLENMKTGVYKLLAKSENIFFDELEVKITPNTPQLPSLVASSFSICGQVVIDKIPEGLTQVPAKRKVIIFPEGKGSAAVSKETTEDGRFCTAVKPNKYVVRVHTTDIETKAGLLISPLEQTVSVVNKPVLDVTFSQFRAKVSGSVNCIEKCGPMEVSLEAVGRPDRQIVQSRETQTGTTFTFDYVMPGAYKVTLLRDNLCWKDKTLDFEVVSDNVANLNFQQTGYILKCTISHPITLNFALEHKEGSVGSFELNKGKNRFCLAEPGLYKLTPNSCHKFEKDVYTYDTSNPETLTFTAIKHLVYGSVKSEIPGTDIIATIRSSVESTETILGPLEVEGQSAGNQSKPVAGPQVYTFSYWARSQERLEVSVKSSEMLYTPSVLEAIVVGDVCPGEMLRFTGEKGVFIIGSIKPPIDGVKVTVVCTQGNMEPVVIETDATGEFKIGPLHKNLQYDVSADKEGYVLAKEAGEISAFRAFKLGKVSVKIVDEAGVPLSDVLLSLSGGKQYRRNNITKEDGSMLFVDLSPGQYYLRPMMKEYKFEPTSQMIDVLEGSTMDINIRSIRVAFSCYGRVTSLNGEPEQGLVVEAMGKGSTCSQYQEESKTEQNGAYRIRGLQPNCTYEVRLKIGAMNRHIERAAPKSRDVEVENSDFVDVNIIAFRRMNQMDISGNVVTKAEHLPTLKVRLYREDNPGVPIHTVTLGVVSFFYLPSLQMDDQMYTVRLESTLSKATHEYATPEIEMTSNVSYKHITFRFEPKRLSLDQELSQSSILVLPLAILVGMAVYNYQKLLPYGVQLATRVQQTIANRHVAAPVEQPTYNVQEINLQDSPITKKKNKPRKT